MPEIFEMTAREAALVRTSIINNFDICRLDEFGNFKGAANPKTNWDGMNYGYLVREGRTILVVDSTPDNGDNVVGRITA